MLKLNQMKKVAGKLKLEAAQYRELSAFAQFGSDLDEETKSKLERGKRLMEIFKQGQYAPIPVVNQVVIFFALTSGLLDDVELEKFKNLKMVSINMLKLVEKIIKENKTNQTLLETFLVFFQ